MRLVAPRRYDAESADHSVVLRFERVGLGVGPQQRDGIDPRHPLARGGQHDGGEVHSHDGPVRCHPLGGLEGGVPKAAAHVQHPIARLQGNSVEQRGVERGHHGSPPVTVLGVPPWAVALSVLPLGEVRGVGLRHGRHVTSFLYRC